MRKLTDAEKELLDEGLDLLKHRIEEKVRFNKSDLELYRRTPDTLAIVKENLAVHQDKIVQIMALQAHLHNTK